MSVPRVYERFLLAEITDHYVSERLYGMPSARTRRHTRRAVLEDHCARVLYLHLDNDHTHLTTYAMSAEIEMDDLKARKAARDAQKEDTNATSTPKYKGGRLNQDADQEQAVTLWTYVSSAL